MPSIETEIIRIGRELKKIKIGNKEVSLSSLFQNDKLQKKLIRENPDLALRLQEIHNHQCLGEKFAKHYERHPEYGSAAGHLAKRYDFSKINLPQNSVRNIALKVEENRNFSKLSRAKHYLKKR